MSEYRFQNAFTNETLHLNFLTPATISKFSLLGNSYHLTHFSHVTDQAYVLCSTVNEDGKSFLPFLIYSLFWYLEVA